MLTGAFENREFRNRIVDDVSAEKIVEGLSEVGRGEFPPMRGGKMGETDFGDSLEFDILFIQHRIDRGASTRLPGKERESSLYFPETPPGFPDEVSLVFL